MLYDLFFKDEVFAKNSGRPATDLDTGLRPLSAFELKMFERVRDDFVQSDEDYQQKVNGVWVWASDVSSDLIGEF